MIIFTADNGFFLGEHGLAGKVSKTCSKAERENQQ
jgi:hypothetical protein